MRLRVRAPEAAIAFACGLCFTLPSAAAPQMYIDEVGTGAADVTGALADLEQVLARGGKWTSDQKVASYRVRDSIPSASDRRSGDQAAWARELESSLAAIRARVELLEGRNLLDVQTRTSIAGFAALLEANRQGIDAAGKTGSSAEADFGRIASRLDWIEAELDSGQRALDQLEAAMQSGLEPFLATDRALQARAEKLSAEWRAVESMPVDVESAASVNAYNARVAAFNEKAAAFNRDTLANNRAIARHVRGYVDRAESTVEAIPDRRLDLQLLEWDVRSATDRLRAAESEASSTGERLAKQADALRYALESVPLDTYRTWVFGGRHGLIDEYANPGVATARRLVDAAGLVTGLAPELERHVFQVERRALARDDLHASRSTGESEPEDGGVTGESLTRRIGAIALRELLRSYETLAFGAATVTDILGRVESFDLAPEGRLQGSGPWVPQGSERIRFRDGDQWILRRKPVLESETKQNRAGTRG